MYICLLQGAPCIVSLPNAYFKLNHNSLTLAVSLAHSTLQTPLTSHKVNFQRKCYAYQNQYVTYVCTPRDHMSGKVRRMKLHLYRCDVKKIISRKS